VEGTIGTLFALGLDISRVYIDVRLSRGTGTGVDWNLHPDIDLVNHKEYDLSSYIARTTVDDCCDMACVFAALYPERTRSLIL
jgi:hypothetical protein